MADMEKVQMLIEMGFNEELSKRALALNNNNVEETMEWMLVHQNESENRGSAAQATAIPVVPANVLKLSTENVETKKVENESVASADTMDISDKQEEEEEAPAGQEHANSLKCDECGKLLKDADAATAHAYKTKHSSFSESVEAIKPKTPEEIEEQKRQLADKLVRLRKEREERERQEQIEREKSRRVQGRQITEIRAKVQEDEMKKLAEERRREKLAAEAHKQRVKEQIAKDREAFKKAHNPDAAAAEPAPVVPQPVQAPVEKRSYDECKIQVRLTDGKTMVHTFKAKEQLAAVRLWVQMNRTDDSGEFLIVQPYPRKQYSDDEMMQTLEMLGLVPASSLMITRKA